MESRFLESLAVCDPSAVALEHRAGLEEEDLEELAEEAEAELMVIDALVKYGVC